MKERIRGFLTAAFAIALVLCAVFAAFAAGEDTAEGAPVAAPNGGTADASPTDASPTDASPTDASPTDARCAAEGHRYEFVRQEADAVMHEVVMIVKCTVCGEEKAVPLSEYNVPFTDGKKAVAEGSYIVIPEGATTADVLEGCPAGTLLLDADGVELPPDKTLGSGVKALFPTSKSYTVLLYGDADGDGQLSPADARFALRLSVNLEEHIEWRDKACHVTADGKRAVLPADARMILRASVGLEDASLFGRAGTATPTDATPTDATPTDATPTDATPTDATPTDAERDPRLGTYECTWKGGVYLREDHSFDAKAAATVPYGSAVTVSQVFADGKDVLWGRITYEGVTGWSVLQYYEQKNETGGVSDV
ncbi:MAG: hypothetical protein IJK89_01085 [Clostridia bacterium]|nr:hypothetical protein [Clostridia bacterium]